MESQRYDVEGHLATLTGMKPSHMGVMGPVLEDAAKFALDCWDITDVAPVDMRFVVRAESPVLILRKVPDDVPAEWRNNALHGAGLTDWAIRQLSGSRLNCPWRYARQLVKGKPKTKGTRPIAPEPQAFCDLMNRLLDSQSEQGRKWLIRCHRDRVRAILTQRYKIMDTFDLLIPTAHALRDPLDKGTVRLDYYQNDETKWKLSFTLTDAKFPVPDSERGGIERFDRHLFGSDGAKAQADQRMDAGNGLIVNASEHGHGTATGIGQDSDYYLGGFQLSNSEVGDGSVNVSPRLWRYYCSNAAIVEKFAYREIHSGMAGQLSGAAAELVETMIQRAITEAVKNMPAIIRAMTEANQHTEDDPGGRLELISKTETLGDAKRRMLIAAFAEESRPTRFGIVQAITRAAQNAGSDRASMEELGGRIAMMAPKEYETVYAMPEKEVLQATI